jgi:predicted lipoprotein with Yx(FWY)xxD motif
MHHLLKLSLPALAASLLIAACGSSSKSTTTKAASATPAPQTATSATGGVVVHTVSNPTYGAVLVNSQGMTLYRLTGESATHFICASSGCVAIWHPLVSTGTPTGVTSLTTVTRPDGTVQVAYKGAPLYTFAQDHSSGETNGQGIKDVGTWTVVSTGSAASASGTSTGTSTTSTSSETSTSAPSSSGGGYAY